MISLSSVPVDQDGVARVLVPVFDFGVGRRVPAGGSHFERVTGVGQILELDLAHALPIFLTRATDLLAHLALSELIVGVEARPVIKHGFHRDVASTHVDTTYATTFISFDGE